MLKYFLVFDVFRNLKDDEDVLEFVSSLILDGVVSGLPTDVNTLKFIVNSICHEKFSPVILEME